jgi:splicing factor 3B subunit 3
MKPPSGLLLYFVISNDFSVAICYFHTDSNTTYVVVGTGKDVSFAPRKCSAAYLRVYKWTQSGLELHYKTEVDDVPGAMCSFQGRLLVGVGSSLRLYDLGKKKLLRKAETKAIFRLN